MANKEALKKFLNEQLSLFISEFQNIKVSVSIDDSEVVFVKVLPNFIYHSDKNYIDWEISFVDTFIEKFPNWNIAFISNDAIVEISHWDFELTGNLYNVPFVDESIFSTVDKINTGQMDWMPNQIFTVTDAFQTLNTPAGMAVNEFFAGKKVFQGRLSEATELVKSSKSYLLAA